MLWERRKKLLLKLQTKVVEKIVDKKADYLIGLKGNQGTLNEDVRLFFKDKVDKKGFVSETDHDKGHGRIESRECTVTENIAWFRSRHPGWENLNSIVEIRSRREIQGEIAEEARYYISSLGAETEKILRTVRQHWGVENKLHWILLSMMINVGYVKEMPQGI